MPRTKIKVKYLRTEIFRNRKSDIKILFYEHGLAEVHVECKCRRRIWSRRGNFQETFAYIPFDECKVESMFDYLKALRVLSRDKVGRRWFIRKMRHCTENFLKPDGNFDYEKTKEIESKILHYSEIYVPELSERQLSILTARYPCTKYRDNLRQVYFFEKEPEVRHLMPSAQRMTYAVLSFDDKLALIKDLLPDFYDKIIKERNIGDCSLSINMQWNSPTKAHLSVYMSDNTYEVYTLN